MTPDELGERLASAMVAVGIAPISAAATATAADTAEPADETTAVEVGPAYTVSAGDKYARACVDVPAASWVAAAQVARDQLGLVFFDWLAGVDEDERGFGVVVHLWSTAERQGAFLRTIVPRSEPVLASLTSVFPGASWPERETAEMFGMRFEGHPNPGKLLLPDEFEGHPLRKDFVLAARVAKAWPGAKEPGESDAGAPSRRRVRPPGVPDPNEWGPEKGTLPPEPPARAERAARAAGDRPRRAPRARGEEGGAAAAKPETPTDGADA